MLVNDTDFDGDSLTAILDTGPTNGTLELFADGSFTYTPNLDFSGEDTFTYVANDGLFDSEPATVEITVNAVNDAPVFVIAADPPASDQDAGPQSVAGFATDLAVGPATALDELADQSLVSFNITVDSTTGDLAFAAGPAIDVVTGDLTYEATAGTTGTAIVSVTLTDDGGTDNDGKDTSATQTFTITVDPVATGISFVDANNNQVFDSGDVALVDGEVEDGVFDTRRTEGGYTTVIAGAGLVIDGAAVSAARVDFVADGDVVINTDLTSTGPPASNGHGHGHGHWFWHWFHRGHGNSSVDVDLRSREGSVSLNANIVSEGSIEIRAALDIDASGNSLEANGRKSEIELKAGGAIDVSGSVLVANKEIELSARGDINADSASFDAGREIELQSYRGDVSADNALLQAEREIELKASKGTVAARGSLLTASGDRGEVELDGQVVDIGVLGLNPTVITAAREIEITAKDQVIADAAVLHACDGEVEIYARNDISLEAAVVRALRDIEVKSRGNVDLIMADLAISGGTRGDIEVKGRKLLVEGATFTAPDRIKLRGVQEGTPTLVDGTKPC